MAWGKTRSRTVSASETISWRKNDLLSCQPMGQQPACGWCEVHWTADRVGNFFFPLADFTIFGRIPISMPPSSRGPGRSPFKAKTGVRISLGAQSEKAHWGFFVLSNHGIVSMKEWYSNLHTRGCATRGGTERESPHELFRLYQKRYPPHNGNFLFHSADEDWLFLDDHR